MKNTARIKQPIDPAAPETDTDRDEAPIELSADEVARILLAEIDELHVEIKNLNAINWGHVVEKAERDAPSWSTLVRAANMENCTYDRVFRWANRAIKAGRTNEARVDGNGKIWVNRKALRMYVRG
jgi:hypothetical protein